MVAGSGRRFETVYLVAGSALRVTNQVYVSYLLNKSYRCGRKATTSLAHRRSYPVVHASSFVAGPPFAWDSFAKFHARSGKFVDDAATKLTNKVTSKSANCGRKPNEVGIFGFGAGGNRFGRSRGNIPTKTLMILHHKMIRPLVESTYKKSLQEDCALRVLIYKSLHFSEGEFGKGYPLWKITQIGTTKFNFHK